MALYALGDMHLSFQTDKNMDIFGRVWHKHEKKIEKNCNKLITDEDTFVIVGDHSWGRDIEHCHDDLEFICNLPGRKIMLRGNHDMFWDPKKTEKLNDLYKDRLYFLQNNFYTYKDYAIVGTKGYCYEGKDTIEHADMLVDREIKRLRKSFDAATEAGYNKFIMFLHYPPTNIFEKKSKFTLLAEAYGVEQVIYAHCHGKDRWNDSILGMNNGIKYSLVSGDYLDFKPIKVID